MKLIIVACTLVAVVVAVDPEPVKIVRSEFDAKPDGSYVLGFETGDGVVREEIGEVKEAFDEENKPHQVVVVRGSYSYTDPEGHRETINYVADETGYHAEGDSIPQAPAGK